MEKRKAGRKPKPRPDTFATGSLSPHNGALETRGDIYSPPTGNAEEIGHIKMEVTQDAPEIKQGNEEKLDFDDLVNRRKKVAERLEVLNGGPLGNGAAATEVALVDQGLHWDFVLKEMVRFLHCFLHTPSNDVFVDVAGK